MYHVYKHASFHLWWKQNLIEHQKVSEYYENDCLQNFLLLFIFLVIAKFVKKSHIYARTHFIFLKTVVKQTWNSFNTKCGPQWKDWKSSYQIWQILVIFSNCSNFSLKQCKRPYSYHNCQRNWVWRDLGQVRVKNRFPETIGYKILETNSSFHLKSCTTRKV